MNQDQKTLNECPDKGIQKIINLDSPPDHCCNSDEPSLRKPTGRPDLGFNDECSIVDGAHALCDPMQTGNIINDINKPNRDVVYRYSKSIRGCDEAMQDLFRDIVVIDDDGKAHNVPIIWGTQEKAVAIILQENVRKDNSLVVDRIKLPALAIYSNSSNFNANRYTYHKAVNYSRDFRSDGKPGFTAREGKHERDTVFGVTRGIPIDRGYTLYAWALYVEDINQIDEQIVSKFSPIAYIRVRGVSEIVNVRLETTANNIDIEPGDKLRIVKYEYNLTAETYVSQPIVRKKAVLKTKIDLYNDADPSNIDTIYKRLEDEVQ